MNTTTTTTATCPDCAGKGRGGKNTTDGAQADDCSTCSATGLVATRQAPLYRAIAGTLQALRSCDVAGNTEWANRHTARIRELVKEHMPSGSGIDSGTLFDLEASSPDRLVFTLSFRHMNDAGYYVGWTHHRAIVTASLQFGISLEITGRDRNDIKNYLSEVYGIALETLVSY